MKAGLSITNARKSTPELRREKQRKLWNKEEKQGGK